MVVSSKSTHPPDYLLLQRGVVIQSFYTDGAPAAQQWPHGMAEMNVLGERGGAAHIRVLEVRKS